ncbi:MAG: metallophosphoesterase [Bacteroidota bacterium]
MKTYLLSFKVYAFLLLAFPVSVSMAQQNLPVTHLQFNDDTSKLQFAIVSDLWGGYKAGVFDDAVEKLELLQPQFVMSVGDLIDGKTYESKVLDTQWGEFNLLVNSLSMPFFYVPGNHDISNPWMEMEWKKRLGRPYYHFVHKNVLFLCINTQDGGSSAINDEQITYFKNAIKDHPDVRWTFIFMHRPVWKGAPDNQGGYEEIEREFPGANYTLFSGHNHTYLKLNKQGYDHYVLGSTGSGPDLRGEKFGKFTHITWVTLNRGESPKILNIKLDGMIKDDVVNENTYPFTSTLMNQDWMTAPGYVAQNRVEDSVTPSILFNNPLDYPLKISGSLSNLDGYVIEPHSIDLLIPSHGEREQSITIKSTSGSGIDLSLLPFIEIELLGSYNYDTIVYEIPAHKKLLLSWKHLLPELTSAEKVARAQFETPDTAGFTSVRIPEYLHNKWYWSGTSDCLLRFKLMRHKRYLYLVALIHDDQLVTEDNRERDLIYVAFEDKNGEASQFTIYPDSVKSTLLADDQTELTAEDIQLISAVEEEGLIKVMLRVPMDNIARTDNSFRFNIGYRDQDNSPVQTNSTIYWKPLWGSETDYQFSGTFRLNKQ